MVDYGSEDLMPHFIYCHNYSYISEAFKTLFLRKLEKYRIQSSILGWFTAYLANVFLTKLQDPILPGRPRDHINPNDASGS